MLEKEIPNPEPGKHKPFIVANFREILDAMTAEEISFSKGVELLNEVAAKYYEPKIIDFGFYLENLELLSKVTVHAPDGSGMGTGIYYKTIEQLYKEHKAQSQTQ